MLSLASGRGIGIDSLLMSQRMSTATVGFRGHLMLLAVLSSSHLYARRPPAVLQAPGQREGRSGRGGSCKGGRFRRASVRHAGHTRKAWVQCGADAAQLREPACHGKRAGRPGKQPGPGAAASQRDAGAPRPPLLTCLPLAASVRFAGMHWGSLMTGVSHSPTNRPHSSR